jgi:TetR/AcrR family transcriptional regulator
MKYKSSDKTNAASPEAGVPPNVREEILAAALTEFSKFGFAGARVDRIAESAGVNKAMIYYYFHSKAKLYEELFRFHLGKIAERLGTGAHLELSLEQTLLLIAETHILLAQARPEIIPIFLRELANRRDEFLDLMAELFKGTGLPEALRTKFQSEMNKKLLRGVDLRQMIISFLTMSMGYIIMSPWIDRIFEVKDQAAFLEQRKGAIVDLFLNGVKVREV